MPASPPRGAAASQPAGATGGGVRGRRGGFRCAVRPGLQIAEGAPAEDRLGERAAQSLLEPGELLGGPAAVGAAGQVLVQIRVDVGAAAPVGHVEHAQIAPALVVGGEFAVRLEAFLAQPLAGPAEFDADVLLVQAEQRGGHRQGLGLDLDVPQHGAGDLGHPLEGAGQQAPAGRWQQPGRRAFPGAAAGAQGGVEVLPSAVGVPLRRDTADGDQHMGPPTRRSGRSAGGTRRRAG
ncbi:hypothetical protein GCM10017687_37150 [Streptomyces echinatus]